MGDRTTRLINRGHRGPDTLKESLASFRRYEKKT